MSGHEFAFRGPFTNGLMNGHIVAEFPPIGDRPIARMEAEYKNGAVQLKEDLYFLDGKHWAQLFNPRDGNWVGTLEFDDPNHPNDVRHSRIIAIPPAVIEAIAAHAVRQMGGFGSVAVAPGTTT